MILGRSSTITLTTLGLIFFSFGCAKKCGCPHTTKPETDKAWIEVTPLGGSSVTGMIALWQEEDGVRFHGRVAGLSPNSKHGFHVHEKGDCSAPDGSSAGGHFSVDESPHAGLHDMESHLGDLGNLETDDKGIAYVNLVKKGATLGKEETSFLGRAVIIHEKGDDLKTQPTGGSGPRIACGVIQNKSDY